MFKTELIKGSTKNLILSVLMNQEMYGYQIIKAIKEKSNDLLEFGEGTIYPALHSMEKDKLLSSAWKKQSNFPDRKYYTITVQGRKYLKKNVKEWRLFEKAINGIYAQI